MNADYRAMLYNTFRLDVTNPAAIVEAKAIVSASVSASVLAGVSALDFAIELPDLKFANDSVHAPYWHQNQQAASADEDAPKPKKPKKTRQATPTDDDT